MNPSSLFAPIYRTGPASSECGTHQHRRTARWRIASALLLPAFLLAGCGGTFDDEDPEVTLGVTPTTAAPSATVTLIALATDDGSVSEVEFYRVTATGNVLLATLREQPYQIETTLPSDATDTVSFFARAIDDDDNSADSARAIVTIDD
jgi:hypothetical protein